MTRPCQGHDESVTTARGNKQARVAVVYKQTFEAFVVNEKYDMLSCGGATTQTRGHDEDTART